MRAQMWPWLGVGGGCWVLANPTAHDATRGPNPAAEAGRWGLGFCPLHGLLLSGLGLGAQRRQRLGSGAGPPAGGHACGFPCHCSSRKASPAWHREAQVLAKPWPPQGAAPQPPALPRTSGFLGRQSYENVGSPTVPGLHRDVPALGGGESGPHHGPRGAPAVRSATPTPSWDSAGHPWSPCRLPRSTGQQQLFLHWTLCTRAGQPLKTCRTCHSDRCVCLKSPSRKPHGLNPERLPSSVGGQGAGGGMPRAGPPELCPAPCPEQTVSALNPAFGTGRAPCWPQSR